MTDILYGELDCAILEGDIEGIVLQGPPGPAGSGVGVPVGGTTGQSLTKHSNTDYDTQWATISGGGGAPTGAAGGSLAGTYPSPSLAATSVADLNLFTSTLKGVTPASGGGTTNFLRADGTWAVVGASLTALQSALLAVKVWSSTQYVWSGTGTAPDANAYTSIMFIDPTGLHDPTTSTGGRNNPNDLWETGVSSSGSSGPAGGSLAGTYPNPTIAANAITTTEILNGTVANADLANMVNNTVKGNVAGSTTVPADLTATQLTTLVNQFTTSLSGAAPASGGGTTNFLRADGTWAAPAGGGGGLGGIIALTRYNPATETVVYTTTSTFADIDATNLAVTFTVPSTGKVLIELSALGFEDTPGGSQRLAWNLREGSSNLAGTAIRTYMGFSGPGLIYATTKHYVSGLSSGASKTYKWGQARTSGTGNVGTYFGQASDNDAGAAFMTVYSVP